MEFIESAAKGKNFWENFGRAMAVLHQKKSNRYGFSTDNFIGCTIQKNRWEKDWVSFFGKNRLAFQLQLAESSNLADTALISTINRLIDRLDKLIPREDQGLGSKRPFPRFRNTWLGSAKRSQSERPAFSKPPLTRPLRTIRSRSPSRSRSIAATPNPVCGRLPRPNPDSALRSR